MGKPLGPYGVALLAVAAATAATALLAQPVHAGLFMSFLLAVTFSAWYGGRRPGLFATALSSVPLAWFLSSEVSSLAVAMVDLLRLLAFVGVGGLIAVLTGGLSQSEHARREDQERLRFALRAAKMASWDWDLATGIITWEPPLEDFVEPPRWAFASSFAAFLERVHPDDRQVVEHAISTAVAERSGCQFEARTLQPDGRIDWIAASGTVLCGPAGKPVRVVGVVTFVNQRKRAEEQLRRAQQELADFCENAAVGIHWAGPDGTVLWANQAELDLLGYAREQYVGHHIGEFHVDPVGAREILERLERGETVHNFEARLRRKDASIRDVLISANVLWKNGRFVHTRCVTRDITERKRAERRLQTQHAVTRILAESPTVTAAAPRILRAVCECLDWDFGAFWVVDRQVEGLRCLDVWRAPSCAAVEFEQSTRSRTFASGVGLPGRVWASGRPAFIADVVIDENFPRAPIALREGLHGAFGFPIVLGTDVLGVIEFFSAEIRAPDEDLQAMLAAIGSQIGQLIERKRVEEEAKRLLLWEQTARAAAEQAERRATFLAEASRVLASSLDYETTLASVARLAVPDIADWCVVDMVEPDGSFRRLAVAHVDPSKVEAAWELDRRYPLDPEGSDAAVRVLRTGRPEIVAAISDAELASSARDAGHLAMLRALGFKSSMCTPLPARERTLGAISFVSAESGRRYGPADLAFAQELATRAALAVDNARLYGLAQEASRAKDEFLAKVSHELRSPLGAMLLWIGMLRKQDLEPEKMATVIDKVERSGRQQTRLIEDLLDVSRVVSGKLHMDFEPMELSPVIEAALDVTRPAAEAKGVRLECTLGANVGLVAGDSDRLQQVCSNLLSNAIKFTPSGGRVEARLERNGTEARIVVSDTGTGISPDFLPHVFEHFAQSENGRSAGGLGLGLAIVHNVVQLHGGTIEVESDGVGQGARFTVRLPILVGEEGDTRAVS